jgi:hypothetical protein
LRIEMLVKTIGFRTDTIRGHASNMHKSKLKPVLPHRSTGRDGPKP